MLNNLFIYIICSIPGAMLAITVHEFTRAAVSTALGDTLPKDRKRLTLNPLKHFEPIGFILLLATGGFGWGKPVETTALYYKNRKRDTILTAVSPIIANILFGFLFVILSRVLPGIAGSIFRLAAVYSVSLGVYNLVPVTPMDGLKILSFLIPSNQYFKYLQYEKMFQMLFLFLLFMGLPSFIFSPIINGILGFFSWIVF